MGEPADNTEAKRDFLDVKDAEIVHGPDVIADKESGALKDADRFDTPSVKPPFSEALNQVRRRGGSSAAEGGTTGQSALEGKTAEVDEKDGSAEVLESAEKDSAWRS